MAKKSAPSILITGAGGFLGTALAAHVGKSEPLVLASRKKIKAPSGAKGIYGDLENLAYCTQILKGIKTVYYTAGFKKNIAVHTGKPFEALAGNTLPLLTFLRAAKKSRLKQLIYVSSTIVEYASSNDEVIDGYVWGKYINEMVLKAFAKETSIDVKIIRSAPLYGPGDNFNPKTANFIPAFIRRVAEAKDEVVIWGNGKRTLQFIYVDDLVRNMVAAASSPKNFFVFGNDERISVNELAQKMIRLSKRDLKVVNDLEKPDKDTMLSTFKNLVAPKTDITTGLERTIEYYRDHA